MSQALPAPENKKHYAGLDGLRAVAVLLVFSQHYFTYPDTYRWGWIGVQIFFVLSGFLITGILYDTRAAPNRYSAFYARRALRIFPLYFAVLGAGWSLWPLLHWELHPAWWLAPLYLSNYSRYFWLHDFATGHGVEHLRPLAQSAHWLWLFYGHFWSLAVEEQFYLIWPFIVFTVHKRRRLLQICVAAVIVVPLLRLLATFMLPNALLRAAIIARTTPFQLDSLLLGAALALWMRGNPRSLTKLAHQVLAALAVSWILFTLVYVYRHRTPYAVDWAGPIFVSVGLTAINLASASLLVIAIDARTLWSRFLNLAWLQSLGKISYGFYVFHDIPHMAYLAVAFILSNLIPPLRADHHGLAAGAVALAGTLILSSLSFNLFETPFLRWKSRFVAERTTPVEEHVHSS